MKQTIFVVYICAVATIALTSCKSTQDELISESSSQLTNKEIIAANVPDGYMELGNMLTESMHEILLDFSQNVKNPNCDDEVLAFAKERYQVYKSVSSSPSKAPGLDVPYEFSQEELEILGKINKMVLMSDDMTLTPSQTQEIMNDINELPIDKQSVLNAYIVIIDEIPTLEQEGGLWGHTSQYIWCSFGMAAITETITTGLGLAGGFLGGSCFGPGGTIPGSIIGSTIGFLGGFPLTMWLNYKVCDKYDNPSNGGGSNGYSIPIYDCNQTEFVTLPVVIDENAKIDLSNNKVWAEPNTTLAGRTIEDSDFVNGTEEEIEVFKIRLECGNDLNETKQKILK